MCFPGKTRNSLRGPQVQGDGGGGWRADRQDRAARPSRLGAEVGGGGPAAASPGDVHACSMWASLAERPGPGQQAGCRLQRALQ